MGTQGAITWHVPKSKCCLTHTAHWSTHTTGFEANFWYCLLRPLQKTITLKWLHIFCRSLQNVLNKNREPVYPSPPRGCHLYHQNQHQHQKLYAKVKCKRYQTKIRKKFLSGPSPIIALPCSVSKSQSSICDLTNVTLTCEDSRKLFKCYATSHYH